MGRRCKREEANPAHVNCCLVRWAQHRGHRHSQPQSLPFLYVQRSSDGGQRTAARCWTRLFLPQATWSLPLCTSSFLPLPAAQAYSAAQKAGEDSRKAVDKLQELQQAKAEADAKLRALQAELAEADHQLAPAQVRLCGEVVGWVWGKRGVVWTTPPAGFGTGAGVRSYVGA